MDGKAPAPVDVAARWWTSPFRMFQTNLRETDAGLDVATVLEQVIAFGADTWLVNAGGILSFYPSDLPFQTRNPHLAERRSGDLLGDVISAAHARGVRVMARMDFSKLAMPVAREHPEWCFVDAQGEWQVQNNLVTASPAGEYFQKRIFDVLDEVLDRYDVDGFFFNWFGFSEIDYAGHYRGVSQDEASRASFAAATGGAELPVGPSSGTYALWRSWSNGVVRDLAARVRDHVKNRRPDVALMLRQSTDLLFHEANNGLGRPFWQSEVSESTSALRTGSPDRAVVVNSVSFFDMPYRMAGEEPARFAQYLIQAIARGANPSTYIMGIPGDIPYPSLKAASAVTRFHAENAAAYEGLRPAGGIGLVRPDPVRIGTAAEHEVGTEFRGLYMALQEMHLSTDVVPEEAIVDLAARGELARFGLLVLPDLGALSDDIIAVLDRFITGGGRVLATGTSAIAEGAAQLADTPIARVVSVDADEGALKSTFVARGEISGAQQPAIAPVLGTYVDVLAAPDARRRFAHLGRAPYGPPEKAYGNRVDGRAGALISASGFSGVIPWTAGFSYADTGLTSVRSIIASVVQEMLPDVPRVQAELPESVEITVQHGPLGLVMHLVNLSGRRRRNFGPALPISGGRISVAGGVTARALVAGRACATARLEGRLEIVVPTFEDFEVIVVEENENA